MVRMKDDMMAGCSPKCIMLLLIGAAIAAGGLWMLVGGVVGQMHMMPWTSVFLWYFGGFVLLCIAKICKRACCPMCRMM